jgi:hypothetical protein
MAQLLERLANFFQMRIVSREALEAYFYRLPNRIQVSWQRDGQYIVGKVSDGKNEFVTQGRSPDDFIEMVNDGVLAIYDIPKEYTDAIHKLKTYVPASGEKQKLDDLSIASSSFGYVKNEAILKAA